MTRFARASGSKGSNDKKPEDATSWQEMKADMLSRRHVKPESRSQNNIENEANVPSTEEISSVWAELVSQSDELKKTTKKASAKKDVKKKIIKVDSPKNTIKDDVKTTKKKQNSETLPLKNTSKKSKNTGKQNIKKESKCKADNSSNKFLISKKLNADLNASKVETEDNPPAKRIRKRNRKRKQTINDDDSHSKIMSTKIQEKIVNDCNVTSVKEGDTKEAEPKLKKRRKEELKPSEVYINGKPVQIAPFDGFLVQAEDAERLRELRKNMKSKGIPENDRERAIKLERRRAEKALARLKKRVCFHCRGSGHNLSECPQVEEDQRSTGICYKCGSTEHTHFQCRVTKSDDYRYAECFICKEQGHIAKQCPDNPRGLYPRGGGCASCGDVTHLKKDCPKYLAEKEDDTMTVGTRNNRALEALDEDLQSHVEIPKKSFSKPKQHIKF